MTHVPACHGPDPGEPGVTTAVVAVPHRRRAWWNAAVGAVGTVVGLAPHLLHHVAPLLGAALLAGAGGTVLFGVLGFAAAIPMLVRLRRRYGNWWAPGFALAIFAVMFSLSTFVIGPAISGAGGSGGAPTSDDPAPTSVEHSQHHG